MCSIAVVFKSNNILCSTNHSSMCRGTQQQGGVAKQRWAMSSCCRDIPPSVADAVGACSAEIVGEKRCGGWHNSIGGRAGVGDCFADIHIT